MQNDPKHEIPYEMFFMDPKDEPDILSFEEEEEEVLKENRLSADNKCAYAQDTSAWD